MSSNFGPIPPLPMELPVLERLKTTTYSLVVTLAASFLVYLIGSSLFLQILRTTIKSRESLNFGMIRQQTVELAALKRLEKSS